MENSKRAARILRVGKPEESRAGIGMTKWKIGTYEEFRKLVEKEDYARKLKQVKVEEYWAFSKKCGLRPISICLLGWSSRRH